MRSNRHRHPFLGSVLAVVFIAALALVGSEPALGGTVTKTIEYTDGDTVLEGFLAYDDAIKGSRPGVVVVHQWMGLTENEKMRCRMLADLGYVAFASDIYGKGIRPSNQQEASAEAGKYYGDRGLLRKRVGVAADWLGAQSHVEVGKIAAIGYCFGGGAVLEYARSGADVAGVVSFHGSLDTPNPEDGKNVQCPVLVLHGAEDPYVDDTKVQGFLDEMRAADVDFQFVAYSGTVHAFTQKAAGDDKSKGAAYNAKADVRSWQAMRNFLEEAFE